MHSGAITSRIGLECSIADGCISGKGNDATAIGILGEVVPLDGGVIDEVAIFDDYVGQDDTYTTTSTLSVIVHESSVDNRDGLRSLLKGETATEGSFIRVKLAIIDDGCA
jgi:hypothetical protein